MSALAYAIPLAVLGFIVICVAIKRHAFLRMLKEIKDNIKFKRLGNRSKRKDHDK